MHRGVADALECHRVCEETINYCLLQGGRHVEASHVRLPTDCADICRLAADFMVRGSEFPLATLRAVRGRVRDVCVRCAEHCEQFGDDAQMRRCAEACRRCAEDCPQMAGVAG